MTWLVITTQAEIPHQPKCNKLDTDFSVMYNNKILVGAMISRFYGISLKRCVHECVHHLNCQSINYWHDGTGLHKPECELNSKELGDEGVYLADRTESFGKHVYAETHKK